MIARSASLPIMIGIVLFTTLAGRVAGQTTAYDKLKAMSGDMEVPDAKTKKEKSKDKEKPPIEFLTSTITPFEVFPYLKRNHWATFNLEMQVNIAGYEGYLQTSSEVNGRPQVPLFDPNEPGHDLRNAMIYRREVFLQKEQRTRLSLQLMFPQFGKELGLELTRPDAIRPDAYWSTLLTRLEPHQMVIPILSAPDRAAPSGWARMLATLPTSGDREQGASEIEKQRYYRLAVSQAAQQNRTQQSLTSLPWRPALSPNPLTWTTISHVVWDGMSPDLMTTAQQQALVDWIYLGGQLIVVANGPSSLAPLETSFLMDLLPATDSGQGVRLTQSDLAALSAAYPPPQLPNDLDQIPGVGRNAAELNPSRYKASEPIRPAEERPVFAAGLAAKPGASVIPIGDPRETALGIEWRVGRGRVLMLAVDPSDPALAAWPGMDSLVRRVILRRIEEPQTSRADRRAYAFLDARQLTAVRLLGRDLGAIERFDPKATGDAIEPNDPLKRHPVAPWTDTGSDLPMMSRDALEVASGITVPTSAFVLKVIVAYILVLVPLNWLVCRYVFRRRELAWVAVPFLSLGFAVAVERAAAYDMGFDSDCTEVNLLELQGGYPRGHLSRFASIYSTGRDRYAISYPGDPTAIALPLNTQRALRGDEAITSVFESFPEPALKGFQVQPRSLSMFRSEAIIELSGAAPGLVPGISLGGDKGESLVNNSLMDLHDAVLIHVDTNRQIALGTIGSGETVPSAGTGAASKVKPATVDWTELKPFLDKLIAYRFDVPEERGEVRLVAWTPGPHPGQKIEPKVDRNRGFRLIVVHLRYGPPPDPAGPEYFSGTPSTQSRPTGMKSP